MIGCDDQSQNSYVVRADVAAVFSFLKLASHRTNLVRTCQRLVLIDEARGYVYAYVLRIRMHNVCILRILSPRTVESTYMHIMHMP